MDQWRASYIRGQIEYIQREEERHEQFAAELQEKHIEAEVKEDLRRESKELLILKQEELRKSIEVFLFCLFLGVFEERARVS